MSVGQLQQGTDDDYREPSGAQMAALKTLVDLKAFEKWSAAGGGVKTPEQLGEIIGCEPYLLERLLRVISATGLASNPGPHQFEMNTFSASLADQAQQSGMRYWYDIDIPIYAGLPSYLAFHGYKTPTAGPDKTCFNWSKNRLGTGFDYISESPARQADFDRCMTGYASAHTPWTEIYPTEKLVEAADPDEIVVVDVGGGVGHDISKFQQKHQLSSGRLMLQDRAKVLEKANPDKAIKVMTHDFFTPQPVKDADQLFLVLHDWPDNMAIKILENLKPAMERGKSKVLIHDFVLFPQGNSPTAAQSDLLMMAVGNAKERTLEMWTNLAVQSGFKITQVHTRPAEPYSVVELELA
ncbi:MAG: hypothetical protein Q9162_006838 [Coniocarpon cinnabarinum]